MDLDNLCAISSESRDEAMWVGDVRILGDRLLFKTGKWTTRYSNGHIKVINDKRSYGDVQTKLPLTINDYRLPVTAIRSPMFSLHEELSFTESETSNPLISDICT